MFKLLKNLKESWIQVTLIIILLCVQAVSDLKLPNYTSKIVNVGIQQSGIENASPDIIRKSKLENLQLFANQDEDIISKYEPIEKNEENIKKYPALENEEIYIIKEMSNEEREELNNIIAKPIMIINQLEDEEMVKQLNSQFNPQVESAQEGETIRSYQPIKKEDMMNIIKTLPVETLNIIKEQINKQIEQMPESIVLQAAIAGVKAEYEQIGMDITKISNKYIAITGLKMLGIALVIMLSAISIMLLSAKVAARLGKTLREKEFKSVLSFSNKEFNEFSTASLITRSTNDIQQIQSLLAILFRVIVYAPIIAIGGLTMIITTTTNMSMAWIIGLAIGVILIIVAVLFGTTMRRFKLMQTLTDKLNLVSREILTGIPVIRAFNTQKREEKRFENANMDLTKNAIFVNNVMSLMQFVMQSIMLLIIWVGGHNINDGLMQVGDMMAFLQYTMQIVMSFLMISMVSIMLPRASVSATRINEVIEKEPSIKDLPMENQKKFIEEKKGLVEFKNVCFKYPDADSEVISDISFTAKPGETTAFIGSTGSGKSTIVNLIPRFYDVTGGEILIDGVNIKHVSQKALHNIVGFVPQKGVLFSGTIESNIKYGKDISDDEMKKVAKIAQAEEFIEEKEEKYQTEIAQGGNNVSGGQKQRLSIARALAIDPEIFVFDDSFSALDMKTDRTLREALKTETKNKTVIMVAQRVGTIMNAEQIIVVEEGKIVGKGTHEELLKTCETYRNIAMSQLSEEELGLK